MNDDELREALRAPGGIEPLDPAKVITGAHRRRKRGVAVVGAAAVAVLAVVAVSVIAGTRPSGSPVVEQPSVSTPSTTKAPRATPQGPNVASLVAACQAELRGHELSLGSGAAKQAMLSGADGTLIVIADGKQWAACDTGYRVGGSVGASARSPGAIRPPAMSDADAFAVANNMVTRAGKEFDYYWAAGMLPVGVTTVRYSFPGGSSVNAVVDGKYWLMRHAVPMTGTPGPERVEVRLLGPSGTVLKKHVLQPGEQTCEQISHGC
jgi:hypothetical protein